MKKNKGISLITLVVMIVIMIILAAVAINVGMNSFDEAQNAKLYAERQQVIDAVTGRFADYQRNSTANPLVGLMIPEENSETLSDIADYLERKFKVEYGKLVTDDELENHTQTKKIDKFLADNKDEMQYTRILIYDDLLALGLGNTTLQAVYLVNYYSSDVVGPIT